MLQAVGLYDVIVVGLGPGGAVAAAKLAREGWRVLVLDRSPIGRKKVCGDGQSKIVWSTLENIGLPISMFGKSGIDYQVISGIQVASPSKRRASVTWDTDKDGHQITVVPRVLFDKTLAEHAIKSKAEFRVGNVIGVTRRGDVSEVTIREGRNQTRTFKARVVIAANGYGPSIVTDKQDRIDHQKKEEALAIRGYAYLKTNISPYYFAEYAKSLGGGYFWVFPIGNGMANVGLAGATSKLRGTDLKKELRDYIANTQWRDILDLDEETIQTWPIPCWAKSSIYYKNGIFYVGDAAYLTDALTGGGIGPAVVSGESAAQFIGEYLIQSISLERAGKLYNQAVNTRLVPKLRSSYRVYKWIASQGFVFEVLFRSVELFPPRMKNSFLSMLLGEHA